MAIKKSELYSSIWEGCDALRGGMDASQYKDYVLVLLFVKYVSDKYAGDPNGDIVVPEGGSFKDMLALRHKKNIGEGINTIIGALAKANDLNGVIDIADFDDKDKLGGGQEMVDRLSNLVAIFDKPELDFGKNRAEGDDILGDAYEYLMRHFATESGKSKGQFYTPGEVSRVIAKVLGIKNSTNNTTFYDPTCGSGSLLLKAIDEAEGKGSIYGQEKDVATAALARMNMFLHGQALHEIHKGQSTLSDPYFKDTHGNLKTFDFVVANPPFSSVNWATGFDPNNDIYQRFEINAEESKRTGKSAYLIPPDKNGDYAFLLHIIKSLKSTGKGACILPHGVLFRGNAEADIRRSLIERGYIKGIIGLPANLFYGTGIPACIIVVDKEGAEDRKSIFMIDASKGFMKDGNKNRLRDQDIHKIVDVFNKQLEVPKYSRMVSVEEISEPKNDYNLNIPRYIDSQEPEDIQDIEAHLLGGIPNADIEDLNEYWTVYPSLKAELFAPADRPGYSDLKIEKEQIKHAIFTHPEFVNFSREMDDLFEGWKTRNTKLLKGLEIGFKPKQTIHQVSEDILKTYTSKALMDKYDVYQHLMNYWNDVMQDDCYLIAVDGWKAEPVVTKKTKTTTLWDCELVPKILVINRFFPNATEAIAQMEAKKEAMAAQLAEMEEEHGGEEGYFAELDKINRANVAKRLKELQAKAAKKRVKQPQMAMAAEPFVAYGRQTETYTEIEILEQYISLADALAELNRDIKAAEFVLDTKAMKRYQSLTEAEIKQLVVDDKWMASVERSVKTEMERISQRLTQRIKELAEWYETTLPEQEYQLEALEQKVKGHLERMGYSLSESRIKQIKG